MQYVRLVHFSNDQINKKTVQKMTNDDKLCVENNISADFFFFLFPEGEKISPTSDM